MRCLLFLLFIGFISEAAAQDPAAQKSRWIASINPTSCLFVHFDKNIYSNNETVWFTGYLIKQRTSIEGNPTIMAVSLVRNTDSLVVLTKKFAIESGLCFGSLDLPDSLQTGDYRLIAYTNQLINGLPEATFVQPITLKTSIDPPFKSNIKFLRDEKQADNHFKVLLSVTNNEDRFLRKPVDVKITYGNFSQKTKTDASGQLISALPIQLNITDPNVYVKLSNKVDSTFLSMGLPILRNKASVKFYPEGGNMVEGIVTVVGLEIKDQQKRPIATKAFLYKDQQVIDTVETSSYGLGKFRLRYDKNAKYSLKLIHDGIVDSIYSLPSALPVGLTLNVANAVVSDTIRLLLKTTRNRNLFIHIHDDQHTFLATALNMATSIQTVKIPLTDMPKGLLSVTIADSLYRPLAERIIFAHYETVDKIELSTKQDSYHQREKVQLKLHLKDTTSIGLVSIAVVQNNRIDLRKMIDIEGYSRLRAKLSDLPTHLYGLPMKDRSYLEQVLLIKGWRRYSWNDLQEGKAKDTVFKNDSLQYTIQLTRGKKLLEKPMTIGVLGNSKTKLIATTASGLLDLNQKDLMGDGQKKLYLFVSDEDKLAYQVNVNDPFSRMSHQLRQLKLDEDIILPSTLTNNAVLVLKGSEKEIRLKEVEIKSKKDDSFDAIKGLGLPGRNACGDYVCRFNILNCPNHQLAFDNKQPVTGHTYMNSNGPYMGCVMDKKKNDAGLVPIDYIRYGKEFYVDDHQDLREPALFSTIYWNYGVLLKGEKDIELSFYTGDLTGKFKIVVQGVVDNDVAYTEKYLEVIASPLVK